MSSAAGRPRPTYVPAALATTPRHAAALLDFQFWCWGQDIVRPQGNLLMAAGATRTRAPQRDRATRYDLAWTGAIRISLWGFAAVVHPEDGPALVLPRHRWAPRLAPFEPLGHEVLRPGHLPEGTVPRTETDWLRARALLASFAHWTAEYEALVRTQAGLDWRRTCAARRPRALRRRLRLDPISLVEAWQAIAAGPAPLLPLTAAAPHASLPDLVA